MSSFDRFSLTLARWLTNVYDTGNPAGNPTTTWDVTESAPLHGAAFLAGREETGGIGGRLLDNLGGMTHSIPHGTRALVATCGLSSGLGNRLRFVLSAQAVADSEHRAFFYYWPVGEYRGAIFGARFDELWQYDGGVAVATRGPEPMLTAADKDDGRLAEVRDDAVISVTSSGIVPGFGGERNWEDLLSELRPTEEVVALAASPLASLTGDFVGVQVRAHPTLTHKKTLEASPVSWFIERMTEIRRERPDTVFYLSCDTAEAQEEIMAAVPDVVALSKTGGYNTRQGLIESVADLVILARSSHLLEPYWSSFAHTAWLMAGKRFALESSARVRPAVE